MSRTPKTKLGPHNHVTALARGMEILSCFTQQRRALSTIELAQLTNLPQPTTWRLCSTLLNCGYLEQDPHSKKLSPSPAVLLLGFAALESLGMEEVMRPILRDLADRFHGAAAFCAPVRDDMVILQRAEAEAMLTLNLNVGSVLSRFRSAVGWAYLAGLPEEEREAEIDHQAELHADCAEELLPELREALVAYRTKGFVVNIGQSQSIINAVALPVSLPGKAQPHVIGISGAAREFTPDLIESQAGPYLVRCAAQVEGLARGFG